MLYSGSESVTKVLAARLPDPDAHRAVLHVAPAHALVEFAGGSVSSTLSATCAQRVRKQCVESQRPTEATYNAALTERVASYWLGMVEFLGPGTLALQHVVLGSIAFIQVAPQIIETEAGAEKGGA